MIDRYKKMIISSAYQTCHKMKLLVKTEKRRHLSVNSKEEKDLEGVVDFKLIFDKHIAENVQTRILSD